MNYVNTEILKYMVVTKTFLFFFYITSPQGQGHHNKLLCQLLWVRAVQKCWTKTKIGTRVHVGSCKKDQLTKLVIWGITLNALFFPFMLAPPANLTFREFSRFQYYLPHLARSLKWCIAIALKTCGHHFAILKPQASRCRDLLWQSLLLMQTEINYFQHVSQISLQFIVGQWCDISISKVNCNNCHACFSACNVVNSPTKKVCK